MRFVAAIWASILMGCPGDPGAPPVCEGPGVICRLAGTGDRSFNGDGRPALETDLYLVSAVRPGPDGLVHLMDFNNHRLRRVETDGTVSTVAGTGDHAYAVEGPATDSPLENPVDFAFDADGSIVLVPLHDTRVLRIETDGLLTVIAGTGEIGDFGDGGPALEATFTELTSVVIDAGGSIFVADGGAHRVRVLRPSGIVEAYAGSGSVPGHDGDGGPAVEATLWRPEALALDAAGNLFVAESSGHVIRKVGTDGTIETIAGTGDTGFSGDGGPATSAKLLLPSGVAADDAGNVYVADTRNDCVRRIDPDGVIDSFAGTGVEGLAGDGAPAREAELYGPSRLHWQAGRLYVADQMNSVARVIVLE